MHHMFFAMLAEFFYLQTHLEFFLILGREIINFFAHDALKLDKIILGHMRGIVYYGLDL